MLKQLVSQMIGGFPQHCCSFKQIESFFSRLNFFHNPLEEAIVAILNLTHGGDKRVSF